MAFCVEAGGLLATTGALVCCVERVAGGVCDRSTETGVPRAATCGESDGARSVTFTSADGGLLSRLSERGPGVRTPGVAPAICVPLGVFG